MSEPDKILLNASKILEKSRWIKHKWSDVKNGVPGYCAHAVIAAASNLSPTAPWDDSRFETDCMPSLDRFRTYLRKSIRRQYAEYIGIVEWNDNIAKSKRQVVKALRDAATCKIETAFGEHI